MNTITAADIAVADIRNNIVTTILTRFASENGIEPDHLLCDAVDLSPEELLRAARALGSGCLSGEARVMEHETTEDWLEEYAFATMLDPDRRHIVSSTDGGPWKVAPAEIYRELTPDEAAAYCAELDAVTAFARQLQNPRVVKRAPGVDDALRELDQ